MKRSKRVTDCKGKAGHKCPLGSYPFISPKSHCNLFNHEFNLNLNFPLNIEFNLTYGPRLGPLMFKPRCG